MKRIGIVEDEPLMREELTEILKKAGYSAYGITDFSRTASLAEELQPDLLIVDINLPGVSGFQICREIKKKTSVPVLVLTSRDSMEDELRALHLGADEYLTKPCRKERLFARVSNVLKRYEGRCNLLEGPGFLLDQSTYTLYIDKRSLLLPGNQGKLLEVFLLKRPETVTKEELCKALWGTAEFIDENAVQVNLTRLKKTMKELKMKEKIVSVRGLGYRLEEAE